jgi:acid phosphatase (class A)
MQSMTKMSGFTAIFFLGFTLQASADPTFLGLLDLPGPPTKDSVEDQSDYQQILQLQNTRSDAECKRAASEENISVATFYGAPYGPLSDAEISKWNRVIKQVNLPAYAVVAWAKVRWQRLRPFKGHADVIPCIRLAGGSSYPSGHAAMAQFYARVLGLAFPDRAEALMLRSREIAFDRTLGGVHYPSDIRDGNLLGDQIFERENKDQLIENLVRRYR